MGMLMMHGFISLPFGFKYAVDILSQFLEAKWVWLGKNGFQFNPCKIE